MILQENSDTKSFLDFLLELFSASCCKSGPILRTTPNFDHFWPKKFFVENLKLEKIQKNVRIQIYILESFRNFDFYDILENKVRKSLCF